MGFSSRSGIQQRGESEGGEEGSRGGAASGFGAAEDADRTLEILIC